MMSVVLNFTSSTEGLSNLFFSFIIVYLRLNNFVTYSNRGAKLLLFFDICKENAIFFLFNIDYYQACGQNRSKMCSKLSEIFGWEVSENSLLKHEQFSQKKVIIQTSGKTCHRNGKKSSTFAADFFPTRCFGRSLRVPK